jgi:hypothetical protein
MMRTLFLLLLVPCAGIVAGCGAPTVKLPPSPPHGGTAFALPEGKGFVEVVRQEAPGKPDHTQLVVYFLDNEAKPLSSLPSAVSFKLKDRGAAALALKSMADANPPQPGALASTPFRDPGEIAGMLSATIESKTFSVAVSLR